MDQQNQQPTPAEPVTPQPQPDTTQPMNPQMQPAPMASMGGAVPAQPAKQTDGMGIASLITAFLGLHLVAFILGLVGRSKAKAQGRKATMSTIGMIWGIVGMLIGLVVIGFLVIGYINLGSTNKKFLNAALAKDYDTACDLWGAKDNPSDFDECKKFLESFAGKYKSYEVTSREAKDGVTRIKVTYTKNDGSTDKGYVDVENGKVTNFIFGAGSTPATSEPSASGTVEAGTASKCLVQSDFDDWYRHRYSSDKGATEYNFKFHEVDFAFTDNIHFAPDSTNYEGGASDEGTLDDWAYLAKSVASKTWTMRLYGSVGVSQGDVLAEQRAQKVKAALVARGVPESKIVIDASKSLADTGSSEGDAVSQARDRVVVMTFDPTCDSSSANQ